MKANHSLHRTAAVRFGFAAVVPAGRPIRGECPCPAAVGELRRSMENPAGILFCLVLVGCGPPADVPKEKHAMQVQQAIAKGGGEANILAESRTLFARLSTQTNYVLSGLAGSRWCSGLAGVTNLGDVFHYDPANPDRIQVRIHNSHFDTYFINLLNPDIPEPANFERIGGNVGFIEPGGPANGSPPSRPDSNRTSAAAGSRR